MCFYTTKYQKPKIAKEDIKCWKVLFNNRQSIYQDHLYETGVKQPHVRVIKHDEHEGPDYFCIDEGYHSYSKHKKAKEYRSLTLNVKIVEFIIPKGTRYYHNRRKWEYVSETIIMQDHA